LNELITNRKGYIKELWKNFRCSAGICMGKLMNGIVQLRPPKYLYKYYPLGCNTLYLGM
jgi:hypothetical protein